MLKNSVMLYGWLPKLELTARTMEEVHATIDRLGLKLPYWAETQLGHGDCKIALLDSGLPFLHELRQRLVGWVETEALVGAIEVRLAWHETRQRYTKERQVPPIAHDSPIADLGLTRPDGRFTGLGNMLQQEGIVTVGDLCDGWSIQSLLDIRYFGRAKLIELRAILDAARTASNRSWLHLPATN